MPPALIDSHCHFDFDVFDPDRDEVWSRCRSLGVRQLLIPGTDPDQWCRAQSLCEDCTDWRFAAGVHPWWLEQVAEKAWLPKWREAIAHPQCVAVGECGLDKFIDTPMAQQLTVLEQHLQLAREHHLPIILHCVKAHNELIRSLKQCPPPAGGVVHAFSGSAEIANTYWQLGLALGVGGTITYERARKTREAVCRVPLEALVLETDAPDMPLAGRQGRRNSPEYLPEVVRALASLRNESVEVLARATTENTRRLFSF